MQPIMNMGNLMIVFIVTCIVTATLATDCVINQPSMTETGLNLTRLGERSYFFEMDLEKKFNDLSVIQLWRRCCIAEVGMVRHGMTLANCQLRANLNAGPWTNYAYAMHQRSSTWNPLRPSNFWPQSMETSKKLNWTSAQQFCRSHGLDLASVETEEEYNLIGEYLKENFKYTETDNLLTMWLGGSDAEEEGTWKWTTGDQMTFTKWGPGEPDSSPGVANCLMLGMWRTMSADWYDFDCPSEFKFVCKLQNVCL